MAHESVMLMDTKQNCSRWVINISIDGRMASVEVSAEIAECLDASEHKAENLYHERRRHWDEREFDEYIIAAEGLLPYSASPEEQVCQRETWDEIMAVLALCTDTQRERFLLYALYDFKEPLIKFPYSPKAEKW